MFGNKITQESFYHSPRLIIGHHPNAKTLSIIVINNKPFPTQIFGNLRKKTNAAGAYRCPSAFEFVICVNDYTKCIKFSFFNLRRYKFALK